MWKTTFLVHQSPLETTTPTNLSMNSVIPSCPYCDPSNIRSEGLGTLQSFPRGNSVITITGELFSLETGDWGLPRYECQSEERKWRDTKAKSDQVDNGGENKERLRWDQDINSKSVTFDGHESDQPSHSTEVITRLKTIIWRVSGNHLDSNIFTFWKERSCSRHYYFGGFINEIHRTSKRVETPMETGSMSKN